MRRYRTIVWGGLVASLALVAAGCGDDGQSNPTPETALSKPTKSGDNQTGAPDAELGQPLRVLVTRDGEPAEQVSVTWTTDDGSVGSSKSLTDANGIAQMTWTLGASIGPQSARASVIGATNSPLSFTATAEEGGGGPPPEPVTVSVTPTNLFVPSVVHVQPGQAVSWVWADGASGHNVTPDDGAIPAPENGTALFTAPHSYSYTFTKVGTYRYYCSAHGGPGGVGMSGTVIVDPAQ
ncbi:MAG TPA: plastocyanin/azurin family copper-binding protein [Gemmatimonadales bacterium]|nr:plastocyanin/azurin family copper-binding protein [Gemmatimonadales bacterium]